jgi:hypothetical protein
VVEKVTKVRKGDMEKVTGKGGKGDRHPYAAKKVAGML